MEYKFIINAFTRSRGEPKMLNLICSKCHTYLFTYQKDGPGPLKRCYWDRIHAPEGMTKLTSFASHLICTACRQYIGKTDFYQKEKRQIFLLEQGNFTIKELT